MNCHRPKCLFQYSLWMWAPQMCYVLIQLRCTSQIDYQCVITMFMLAFTNLWTVSLYFTTRLPMCNHHVHVGVYQFMNYLPQKLVWRPRCLVQCSMWMWSTSVSHADQRKWTWEDKPIVDTVFSCIGKFKVKLSCEKNPQSVRVPVLNDKIGWWPSSTWWPVPSHPWVLCKVPTTWFGLLLWQKTNQTSGGWDHMPQMAHLYPAPHFQRESRNISLYQDTLYSPCWDWWGLLVIITTGVLDVQSACNQQYDPCYFQTPLSATLVVREANDKRAW